MPIPLDGERSGSVSLRQCTRWLRRAHQASKQQTPAASAVRVVVVSEMGCLASDPEGLFPSAGDEFLFLAGGKVRTRWR